MLSVRRSASACVLLACVLAGCGSGDDGGSQTAGVTTARPARDGAKVQAFAAESYPGGPRVTAASLAQTAEAVRRRGAALGQEIDTSVENERVVVACTGCTPPTATGRLAFYDWEANVRDTRCRARPKDTVVTGGLAAGQPGAGSLPYYEAVFAAAAHCRTTHDADDLTADRWYGVDGRAEEVLCGPRSSAAALRAACAAAGRRPTRLVEVPRGTVIAQAESDQGDKASRSLAEDAYFILADEPALVGSDLTNVEADTDQQTGQPTVVFDFTAQARPKWRKVTRTIARRGAAAAVSGTPASSTANHFAIVLDGRLISVPYIDPEQNPNGISGQDGAQISGSFTAAGAKELAATLSSGPLPLALTPVRRVP